ncbi:hypothetical protein FQY83_01435 [Luteimonas marina]|uniref:Uncharacterized protein n=1 Tax=Luteimonas marina TaxID=488485 RepID=A0A5C5UBM4_9GAMM|nr:hypothetical protein [Luteimonas marina]TWT23339.1 hypothetical protein FQY83_01435 [Luteimonas marina]
MDKNANTTPAQALPMDDLRTGDILLMLGEGPLSDLIAWASDGPYSHAAVVADGGDLIEAAASGVRRYPLAQRIADQVNYHFIDAYRMHGANDGPLDAADLADVLAKAESLLGIPYPIDQLALLGAIMAVRGKWPEHPWARLLVRVALDHALPDATDGMVCSEVVYRAYAECAATPAGRLAPEIVVGERGTAPFPEIDWKALFDEIWPLLKPGGRQALQSPQRQLNALRSSDIAGLDIASASAPDVSDEELERARQAVLGRLGAGAAVAARESDALLAGEGPVDPKPNPRLVSPQDLAASPSVALLGRLMQRPGG